MMSTKKQNLLGEASLKSNVKFMQHEHWEPYYILGYVIKVEVCLISKLFFLNLPHSLFPTVWGTNTCILKINTADHMSTLSLCFNPQTGTKNTLGNYHGKKNTCSLLRRCERFSHSFSRGSGARKWRKPFHELSKGLSIIYTWHTYLCFSFYSSPLKRPMHPFYLRV